MSQRNLIGLVYNARMRDAAALVDFLVEALKLRERCWTSAATEMDAVQDKLESTSTIITVGGDGTILRVVRVAAPFAIPILGINMGRIGFMTELSVAEAIKKVPEYLNGGSAVEKRMMLQTLVLPASGEEPRLTAHALNDVVLGRGAIGKLLDISATIDGVPVTTYRADAVIAATATGSTGYALSAGGPVIHPQANVILVQPVAPHTGLRTGLLLPGESVIELSAGSEHQAILSVDGSLDMPLSPHDKVVVRRSQHVARFLRMHPSAGFYASLAQRLGLIYGTRRPDTK